MQLQKKQTEHSTNYKTGGYRMKGQKYLKVTSILMIIGGVIGIIAGIIAILGVSALVALTGSAEEPGLLYAGSIIVTVASVIEFIAGIKGLGACKMPQKADACIKLGIIIAVLSIVSMIVNVVGGGEFNVTSLILNLLVPGAYVYGAIQMKKDSQG